MTPLQLIKRVWPKSWHRIKFNGVILCKGILICALAIVGKNTLAFDSWQVDPAQSSLKFRAIQEGNEIEGRFERFDSRLFFDKNNLEQSYFEVTIDLNSVNSDVPDRDDLLRSVDFFNIITWPEARFRTQTITHLKDDLYRANASLSIRNITLPIQFDFTLVIKEENQQKVLLGEGSALLDRFEFDMAHGDFTGTDTVGAKIRVLVKIRATRPR